MRIKAFGGIGALEIPTKRAVILSRFLPAWVNHDDTLPPWQSGASARYNSFFDR